MEEHSKSVVDLFSEQVLRGPTNVAVSFFEERLTYSSLDRLSSELAAELTARGIGLENRVVVLVKRDLNLVPTLLGVLKAGACYIPVDVETFSYDHILETLQIVQPKLLITSDQQVYEGFPSLNWTTCLSQGGISSLQFPSISKHPNSLAYIIFTSGTTSRKKGVMIPHRAIANYVQQGDKKAPFNMAITSLDTVALIFSPGFDACTGVVFSTICNGGTLKITSPAELEQDLKICTILPATPSLLNSIKSTDTYPNLRSIFLGGESPCPSLVTLWASPEREMWNCYGPSETTCASLLGRLLPDMPIVLGRSMPNSEVLLLNPELQESDEGEICISGPGLARGYFQNDKMTGQAFFEYKGHRLYHTGDFARREAIGLRFLGRHDSLIKNRGFLINLELDVQPMLQTVPGVDSSLAFQHSGMLVAVVTPSTVDGNKIRSLLAENQDAFLVPDIIMEVDSIPMTSNGKSDIKHLRRLLSSRLEETTGGTGFNNDGHGSVLLPEQSHLLQTVMGHVLGLPASSISDERSFWDLGGNSLKAVSVLSELRNLSYTLPFGELLGNCTLRNLATMLERVEKLEQSDFLSDPQPVPMTELQKKMLAVTTANPALNYLLISAEISHENIRRVDLELRSAVEHMVSRHGAFRLKFSPQNNTQVVAQTSAPLNWRDYVVEEPEWSCRIDTTKTEMTTLVESIDSTDPPTLFRLITIPNRRSMLLWLVHHGRVDGWSARVLFTELQRKLDGDHQVRSPQFDQAMHMTSKATMDCLGRCNGRSAYIPTALDLDQIKLLPYKRPQELPSWCHTSTIKRLTSLKIKDLEASARIIGVTGSTVLYATWALLMMKYTDSPVIAFGTVVSGRNHPMPGSDQVVGPMLQPLSLVTDMSKSDTKSAFLGTLQSHLVQLNNLDWSTLEHESQHSNISRRLDTMIALQYDLPPLHGCRTLPGPWKIDVLQVTEHIWTLLIEKQDENLLLHLVYDNRVVTESLSQRILVHFQNLLDRLLDPVDCSIKNASQSMLAKDEYNSLIQRNALSCYTYQGPKSLKEAFEAMVDIFPATLAILTPATEISYLELDHVTNRIATSLLSRISPREVVAVLSDGSVEWIFAILAVLKTGAAYCTIDAQSPSTQLNAVLKASKSNLLICPDTLADRLANEALPCSMASVASLLLNTTENQQRLANRTGLEDIAYMVCSSGTTSQPKAIYHSNLSLLSYLSYEPARVHAGPGIKLAQTFSGAFDACAAEIFGALCHGGTLVLKDLEDPLWNLRRATAAIIVPSFLSTLVPSEFPKLRTIMVGGEVASQFLIDSWSVGRTVYNGYGPCECSVACLVSKQLPGLPVTLGRPVPGMSIYILDSNGDPVPIGLPGEIWASGVQVADGYAMCGADDGARFQPDPFQEGFTMFRTGDIGRWTPNMEVEYVGRLDRQVKIRGYRINLEDVEDALQHSSPLVTHAAALQSSDSLVAFVAPDTVDLGAVKENIFKRLPGYMHPSFIKAIKVMPRTLNQKIDYRALNDIKNNVEEKQHIGTTPDDLVSAAIADIWRKVLQQTVCVEHGPFMESDFLLLGGHSLLQIAVSRELTSHFGRNIPLRIVMTNSVLSELSDAIRKELERESVNDLPFLLADRIDNTSLNELSSQERQLVMPAEPRSSSSAFNCALLITIEGKVDYGALIESLDQLLNDHRLLRSRYKFHGLSVSRTISGMGELMRIVTIPTLEPSFLEKETNRQFDLSNEQPIRLTMIRIRPDMQHILLVAHHCIADETTLSEILRIMQRTYARKVSGDSRDALENQTRNLDYLDWVHWRKLRQSTEYLDFWKKNLQGARPIFNRTQDAILSMDGQTITAKISQAQVTAINQCRQVHTSSMQNILLAGAVMAIRQVYDVDDDVLMAIPFSNRSEPGSERMLGCFLDYVHVRIDVKNGTHDSINDILAEVETASQRAVSNYVPSETVLEAVRGSAPLFDVMLSYHPQPDSFRLDIPGCTTRIHRMKARGSKFPMMIELFHQEDGISFDIEYDTMLVSHIEAQALQMAFMGALEQVCSGTYLEDSWVANSS